jgi:hypothetical protein
MESEQLVSPSRQCSCTPAKDFVAEHNMKTLEHPPTLLTWLQLIFTNSRD